MMLPPRPCSIITRGAVLDAEEHAAREDGERAVEVGRR